MDDCLRNFYLSMQNNSLKDKSFHKEFNFFGKVSDEIKAIAFYLPQFHPFEENDKFWGKGFTEWTNVGKAIPQFVGHYQPKLPGELGYYDLRLPEVQERQVELAKNYGIYGFCFYSYWFSGKRLMTLPLDNFYNNKSLDLKFCVCWANENWTRRWDGKEQEILIPQEHDPKLDQNFIYDHLKYFEDERYIRIDNKPVLIIYRRKLMASVESILEFWRKVAKDHGYDDLFMISVQSFDEMDPLGAGFDAALQFPPHNMIPLNKIPERFEILDKESFNANIYDYSEVVNNEKNSYKPLSNKQIRCAFPAWDNTSRRKNSNIYANSNPALFEDWLTSIASFSKCNKIGGESLIFINAWNEWAEGAYLEPDRKYGYAYLEAVRRTLNKFDSRKLVLLRDYPLSNSSTFIHLHLFYPEMIEEFKNNLKWTEGADLYISVSSAIGFQELEIVRNHFPKAAIIQVCDKGRDVLPFLNLLRSTVGRKYQNYLRIPSGNWKCTDTDDRWRKNLIDRLYSLKDTEHISLFFSEELNSLFCTKEYVCSSLENSNEPTLLKLCERAGLKFCSDYKLTFMSMFWISPDIAKMLVDLNFTEDEFLKESGSEIDGSFANGVEKFIGYLSMNYSTRYL